MMNKFLLLPYPWKIFVLRQFITFQIMNIREGNVSKQSEPQNAVVGTLSEYRENLLDFTCSNCNLSVKCRFGKLEFEKAGCKEECYYMRNPFEPPNYHKAQREYTIDDFVIVGSKCFICELQICSDEECSVFYKNTYCLQCVWRERASFPDELILQVSKQKKAKEVVKQK